MKTKEEDRNVKKDEARVSLNQLHKETDGEVPTSQDLPSANTNTEEIESHSMVQDFADDLQLTKAVKTESKSRDSTRTQSEAQGTLPRQSGFKSSLQKQSQVSTSLRKQSDLGTSLQRQSKVSTSLQRQSKVSASPQKQSGVRVTLPRQSRVSAALEKQSEDQSENQETHDRQSEVQGAVQKKSEGHETPVRQSKGSAKRHTKDSVGDVEDVLESKEDAEPEEGKRADISIATIEKIANKKREARHLRNQRKQEREDRERNEAVELEKERKERAKPRESRRTQASVLSKEYDDLLLLDIEDETSSSDITVESDFSHRDSGFSFARDIFASLEDMPRLSELTLSSEEKEAKKESFVKSQSIHTRLSSKPDEGYFVNPLTGDVLDSSTSESSEVLEYCAEEQVASEDASLVISLGDFEDDDEEKPRKSRITLDTDVEHEAALLNFKLSQTILNDYSLHSSGDPTTLRNNRQTVWDFINTLIKHVVNQGEDAASKAFLSRRLDKKKLYNELKKVVEDYQVENYQNNLLNHKAVDFFRRIQMTRHMDELGYSDEVRERRRYKAALVRLDQVREKAAMTKSKCTMLISSVMMDLDYMQNLCISLDARLVELVRKTFAISGSDLINKMVDREIQFLSTIRGEVSDFRQHFIAKKHTLARYDEKILQISTINDDVNMDSFLHVQNECNTLGKKLEEKTATLDAMHAQYYEELHMLLHIREKSLEISDQMHIVHTQYKAKYAYQLKLRENLFNLKLERDKSRKELRNLTFQGGLLFHHSLMMDFDDTVEKVSKLRAVVQKLKNSLQQLEGKLETLVTSQVRE